MSRGFVRRPQFDVLEGRQLLSGVQFAIDSSLSRLTIDAKVHTDAGTIDLGTQDDGLDTAAYEGTLLANITKRGVQFQGGSDIRAIEHDGKFDPGDDDAAYAVDGKVKKIITLAKFNAAVRDLTLDLTQSDRKPTAGSKHKFLLRDAELKVTSGDVDYDLDSKFGDADGSESFAGEERGIEDGFGRLTGSKGERIITIPIEVVYKRELEDGIDGTFKFTGQLVGREVFARTTQALIATNAFDLGKRHIEAASTITQLAL